MAIFRKIHTSFWSDSFISDLDKDKKLFYLYLLTNERTRQCGVYEITKKQISFDLGYSIDTVSKLLEYFIKIGKIRYNDTTKELAIGNWLKFNSSTSPKVKTCIDKEFQSVKDTLLIQYVRSMDTHSQEEEEQEQEEEREQEEKKETAFLSDVLNSEYIAVLELWLQHKKERKENYKPTGLKTLAEKIKKDYKTVQEFESVVKHSIANNWAGMYAPKTQINQTANTAAPNKMVY
jgi:hypothetical protein